MSLMIETNHETENGILNASSCAEFEYDPLVVIRAIPK